MKSMKYYSEKYDWFSGLLLYFLIEGEEEGLDDVAATSKVCEIIIKKNSKEINDWLKNAEINDAKAFKHDFNKVIGYGMRKGDMDITPRTKAKIVLEKTGSTGIGYAVKTDYPIENK